MYVQDILDTCGYDKISCAIDSNIFSGSVVLSDQVHSLATGIGNTSLNATRDWLMQKVLVATDDYSRDLSTNMTSILRSRYDLDDRVRKAWFINPGRKWRRATTGVQSQLLLSDKVIIFAVITLNDGSGNILRRRMLEFTTLNSISTSALNSGLVSLDSQNSRQLLAFQQPDDETRLQQALQSLVQKPVTDSMPPLAFGINVPFTVASIYGEEQQTYLLLTIQAIGRFDGLTTEEVNREMMRRIMQNQKSVCTSCRAVYPAFENMLPSASTTTGRRLLQQQQQTLFDGSVTILLVYEKDTNNAIVISYPDILMSIYNTNFTGSLLPTVTNQTALQKLAEFLSNNNIFVSNVTVQTPQNINILVSRTDSLFIPAGNSTNPPPAASHDIDVQVYGMEASKWKWDNRKARFLVCEKDPQPDSTTGELDFSKCSDVPSSAKSLDPWKGIVFLAASVLLFCSGN